MRSPLVLTALLAAALVLPLSASAPIGRAIDQSSLADLDWLAGRWVKEDKGQYLEETWSAPVNNSLTGMFRWNRDGKPWMCELMNLTLDGAGKPIFRLRHFDAALKPWEKDEPLTYPVTKIEPNRLVCEDANAPAEHPRRFIYSRLGEQLTVRLEKADGSGDDYRFTRVAVGGDADKDDAGAKPQAAGGAAATADSSGLAFTGGLVLRFNVLDRAKSRQWYHDMLGFEVLFEVDEIEWTEMTNREAKMTIGLNQSPVANVSAGTVPVIGVRDLDAARKTLEAKSVKFTGDTITHTGLVKLATLLDPDGHQIMLYQALGD